MLRFLRGNNRKLKTFYKVTRVETTETIIEVKDLSKQYNKKVEKFAIKNLNLTVQKGQLFGLIGPDGAGKTTTLRIISTVMEPTDGDVSIAGHDIRSNVEDARRLIGYMPQNFSLYPDLSVMENLNFFANINNVPKERKQERIQSMLKFTRLERFQNRRAGNLSGGMKKKLALACALIHDPQVLILDEPSTGVDPVSRRELWMMLADVVNDGVSVLVSTPYMDEAERCHRVGILNNGELLVNGTPRELEEAFSYEIVEVKARPRKAMRLIVSNTKGVHEWRPVGDRLRISVDTNATTSKKMLKTLHKQFEADHLEVKILRQAKPTMEDVFVDLVLNQQEKK